MEFNRKDFYILSLVSIIMIMTQMDVTPTEFFYLVRYTLPNYLQYKLIELEDFDVSDDDLIDMTTNTFNNFGRGNKTTKWKKENVMDEKIYGVLKKKKKDKK